VWLRGPQAEAAFTPSEGFYCTAFRVRADTPAGVPDSTSAGAGWWSVLAEPPSWEHLRARPAFYGNPLLFPFPMAVSEGRFTYRGREIVLPPSRERRVIHGFVRDVPWTVERQWSDADGAHLRASLTTAGAPDLLERFPFPFRLGVTYSLQGTSLALAVEASNLGGGPMPAAFGVHPYFPLPLTPGGRTEDLRVRADVTHTALTAPGGVSFDLRPAGETADLAAGLEVADWLQSRMQRSGHGAGAAPAYARVDPASGSVFPPPGGGAPEGDGDGAAGASAAEGQGIGWSLTDTRRGYGVAIESGAAFRVLVLFAPRPPTILSPVLCTCLPDAFNLAAHGHGGGMVEIPAGGTWATWVRLSAHLPPSREMEAR
jgi:hypothetical protein